MKHTCFSDDQSDYIPQPPTTTTSTNHNIPMQTPQKVPIEAIATMQYPHSKTVVFVGLIFPVRTTLVDPLLRVLWFVRPFVLVPVVPYPIIYVG